MLALAFICLLPGVTLPVMTLTGTIDKAELVSLGKGLLQDSDGMMHMLGDMAASLLDSLNVSGEVVVYEKTRSILGTVFDLMGTGNIVVGFLLMLFSVIVPLIKIFLMLAVRVFPQPFFHGTGQTIAQLISKWSMVDVFVVAIIVAYLAGNASGHMDEIFVLNANFESGFYFFLGYCLLSIASAQLLEKERQSHEPEKTTVYQ